MRSQSPNLAIPTSPLNPETFAPFGEVIQNPSTHNNGLGLEHTTANQGTATKWLNITHLTNFYDDDERALSKKSAKLVMNLFICQPRVLAKLQDNNNNNTEVFRVGVLERHPFTGQTFLPLGVAPREEGRRFLVIVAPTLPLKRQRVEEKPPYPVDDDNAPRMKKKQRSLKERLLGARPNPFTNDYVPSTTTPVSSTLPISQRPKGSGLPDLKNIRAFIARGDQAVTYGPGTWHAPMVVLGGKEIEFVVVQYANGVGDEDCQECALDAVSGEGIVVDVGGSVNSADEGDASKPGYMRAKL